MAIKTKAALKTDVDSKFPTNTVGSILASTLRGFLKDFIDSVQATIVQSASISSGAVTIDFANGPHVRISLTENITSMTLTPDQDGQRIIIEMTQDNTGGRTVAWPSNVRFSTDLPSGDFVPDAAADKKTYFGLVYHTSNAKFDALAITKGF